MQYREWHTLDINTLRNDVLLGVIDANDFKEITGEDYVVAQ